MSQDALFDASVYVRRAYDELVLAFDAVELEQLHTLKLMVLQTYVAIQEMSLVTIPAEQLNIDELNPPF